LPLAALAKQVKLTLIPIKAPKIERRYFPLAGCAVRDVVCCASTMEDSPVGVAYPKDRAEVTRHIDLCFRNLMQPNQLPHSLGGGSHRSAIDLAKVDSNTLPDRGILEVSGMTRSSQNAPDAGASASSSPHTRATSVRALDRERLFFIFFFAAYFFLVYQLFRVLAPFLAPILSAVMLTLVVFPVRQMVERRLHRPTLAALLTTVLTMVTIVVPVTVLTLPVINEATNVVPALHEFLTAQERTGLELTEGRVAALAARFWDAISGYAATIQLDISKIALEAIQDIGKRATLASASMVRGTFLFMFQIVVFMFALFFFLRDGSNMTKSLLDLVPMEGASKALVLESLNRTLVAMVRGTVITASAQGAMTGIGLAIFGAPFPILLGFAATFLAVVPFVGAALVWAPAAIYLFFTDHPAAAMGLAVWGLLFVGLIDNILRPIVVGEQSRLPITLLLLGVLGGIQVYGLIGGMISPLLIACVFAFARIYRERYLGESLPPTA
jgi:predicted PurR-regulated permease PerM